MEFRRNVTRRLPVLALVAGALAAAPAAGQAARISHAARSCANADTPASVVGRQPMRDAVVCLINQQRTSRHLPALRATTRLDRSAQGWTNSMVSTGVFSHGTDFAARISAVGYVWTSAGENIATGFQTPRQVVSAWMASDGHCRNILDPTFADVGTGVSTHHLGQYGPSTWTQDFGLWMGHSNPSRNYGPQRGCPYRV
jgi:uncharacterized protein YkwD